MIRNPDYKGKWTAPMIDNPAYKGPWAPRKIANPNYFVDDKPASFTPLGGIGYEIWTMDEDILFDNIYIGHSRADADKFAKETFFDKLPIEQNREKKEEEAEEAERAKAVKAAVPGLVSKVRSQVDVFIKAAKEDPVSAAKEHPQVAGGLVAVFTVIFGLLGLAGGILGGSAAPAVAAAAEKKAKGEKKVDEPSKAKTTAVKDKNSSTSKRTVVTAGDDE